MTTDLDTIPDPPARLCEFNPDDWPAPPSSSDHIPMNAQLYRREQQRIARERWGAEHGLHDWQDIVDLMARGRARLYSERARTAPVIEEHVSRVPDGTRESPEPDALNRDHPGLAQRVDSQSYAAEHARAHLGDSR